MPNSTYTQQALAGDPQFRQRVKSSMSSIAWQVISENDAVPNHISRVGYARQVLRQLENEVSVMLPTFVMRPNVNNFETTYDFAAAHVVSASGDPDLLSQIFTDWNEMATAAGFPPPPTPPAMTIGPPLPPQV